MTTVLLPPGLPGSPLGPSAPGAPAGPGTGTGTGTGTTEGEGEGEGDGTGWITVSFFSHALNPSATTTAAAAIEYFMTVPIMWANENCARLWAANLILSVPGNVDKRYRSAPGLSSAMNLPDSRAGNRQPGLARAG